MKVAFSLSIACPLAIELTCMIECLLEMMYLLSMVKLFLKMPE